MGFVTLVLVDDNEYFLVINNYLEFVAFFGYTESYEVVYFETTNEDDFLIKVAPPKFEEEKKSIIDKFKEINLVTNIDFHPTFISSLFNEEESNNPIKLNSWFKDCFP